MGIGLPGLSWLTWPKAKDFRVESENKVVINDEVTGAKLLEYEFV